MNMLFRIVFFTLSILVSSCATSLYDHYTFTETLEAKVQTESLIKQSVNPYTAHAAEIVFLKNRLNKMVMYERSKSKNPITLKMWEFVNSKNSSIHQFIELWKEKGTLSPVFTEEYSEQANEIFQLMLDYESKKDTESESALLRVIGAL